MTSATRDIGSTEKSLRDKTIVVTGGSRGLGLGLVEALVDQGAKVTVVARDKNALASVKVRPSPWRPPTSRTRGPRSAYSPRSGRTSSC